MIKTRLLLESLLFLLGRERGSVEIDELLKAIEKFLEESSEELDESVLEALNELRKEGMIELNLPYVKISSEGLAEFTKTYARELEEDRDLALKMLLAAKLAQKAPRKNRVS